MNGKAITTDSAIQETVHRFIVSNFLFGDDSRQPRSDESLLESGTIDSMGVLELVAFLERTFHISVHSEELVPENLDSVVNAASYVQRKLAR